MSVFCILVGCVTEQFVRFPTV